MDPCYHVADLCEVRLLVSDAQSARGVRAGAATHRSEAGVKRTNRHPARRVALLVPEIAAVAAVIIVIKQVHIMVQIVEEHAQLRTTAQRSAKYDCFSSVIKQIVPISSIVIVLSFLEMAALTQKEKKLNRSELIAMDVKSARSTRLRCALLVEKMLRISAFIQYAPRSVKYPLRIVTAKEQSSQSSHLLLVIVLAITKVVP